MKRSWLTVLLMMSCVSLFSCEGGGENAGITEGLELGRSELAIVNGKVDYSNPAIVALGIVYGSGNYSTYCTGTLIHPRWVLTAAHCVVNPDYPTIGADNNKNMSILVFNEEKGKSFKPESIIWHGSYRDASKGYDIALIKLEESVGKVSETDLENVKPILPHPKWLPIRSTDLPIDMLVAGYGITETGSSGVKSSTTVSTSAYCGRFNPSDSTSGCSKSGYVKLVGYHPNAEYARKYGYYNTEGYVSSAYGTIFSNIEKTGQCQGDSGGPTLYRKGGVDYVTGVTSYGDPICRGYNVSTAVQDYYDWIIAQAPEVKDQYREICGNGVDDDGNGQTDSQDIACKNCGDGQLNVGEECDKDQFMGGKKTCAEWNSAMYSAGNVTCNPNCTVNYSACTVSKTCGNNKVDEGEACDGIHFDDNVTECAEYDKKYTAGSLKCVNCKLDFSNCKSATSCGNKKVDGGEDCDGTAFAYSNSCNAVYPSLYASGTLKCTDTCTYDTSSCQAWCGNGKIDKAAGELCDGDEFGGATCATLTGPGSSGTLKCDNGCRKIDTTGCSRPSTCGNKKLDPGEDCDFLRFAGDKFMCKDWDSKYSGGMVMCNDNCTIDYSFCWGEGTSVSTCGDGKLDAGEVCDKTAFLNDKSSCAELFPGEFTSGSVTCNEKCEYDVSACASTCGNGKIDATLGEVCDRDPATGQGIFPPLYDSCEKVVGAGSAGTLSCSDDCKTIVALGCSAIQSCGNNVLDAGELCDGAQFANKSNQCKDWNPIYESGVVVCNNICSLDYSGCKLAASSASACGNDKLDEGEECDGIIISGDKNSCSDWDSNYVSGKVSCSKDCQIDYSGCRVEGEGDGESGGGSVGDSDVESGGGSVGDECAASPYSAPSAPSAPIFFGLIGLALLARRKKNAARS